MFDVKATEAGLPLLFQIPGLPNVGAINAHARVQLKQVEVQEGMLPVAVPDLRFTYAFATFVNEASGASLGTVELKKTGTSGNDQLWATPAAIPVSIASGDVGVRIRLVGGVDPNSACGQLYTECYDVGSTNGVAHIRGWSTGTAPAVRNAWLLPGTCLPDAYFATSDCSGGIQAEIDLGATHPLTGTGVTAKVWAEVDGNGPYQLTRGGTTGLVTWTALGRLLLAGGGTAHRRPQVELGADRGHVERADLHDEEQQPLQGCGSVRPCAACLRRRRPLGTPAAGPGVRERCLDVREQLLPDRDDAHARHQYRRQRQPEGAVTGDRPGDRATRNRQPEPIGRLRSGGCEPR
jgi:hypothetical protein